MTPIRSLALASEIDDVVDILQATTDRMQLFRIQSSSPHLVNMVFLGESLVLACAASVIGYITGAGVAAWIGRVNFHAAVVPRLGVFPIVLLGAITIAIISSLLPLAHLQKLEPAMMLKGD